MEGSRHGHNGINRDPRRLAKIALPKQTSQTLQLPQLAHESPSNHRRVQSALAARTGPHWCFTIPTTSNSNSSLPRLPN
jgi:hypothetical protein